MDRIVIVKLSSLGDIIHTLPAFKVLRENYPESEILWIVEKGGKAILEMVEGIDKIYTIDTKELRRGKHIVRNISDIKRLKKIKADILFDFQGTMKSSVVTSLVKAQRKIGFSRKNLKEKAARFFYNESPPYFEETEHIIKKNLHLLSVLDIKTDRISFPEFKFTKKLENSVKEKLKEFDTDKAIILNIGGSWETKRLEREKWVEIARILIEKGYFPLILWGNEFEKKEAAKIAVESDAYLSPQFDLKELFPLIKSSLLLISGDTLPLHIAEALDTPTVSFFGPTLPSRNGPINPNSQVIFHKLKCSGCFKRECSSPLCIKKIKPSEIIEKVEKVLKIVKKS